MFFFCVFCSLFVIEWLEEKNDIRRNVNKNAIWNNFGGSATHAYTTGRRHIDSNLNKIRPKGPSQTLKVNRKTPSNSLVNVHDGALTPFQYTIRFTTFI